MGRLWLATTGYVIIRIKGSRLETFLNMANREGILLWNVSRPLPDRLYCSVSVDGFRRLRPIIRALRLSVDIRRRRGFPFVLQRVFRRRALVAGIIIFALAMYVASSYIWFIDLSRVPNELREKVKVQVQAAGLRPGVRRSQVNPRNVEREILTNLDDLSWAAVRLQGTAAFVEVVERTTYEVDRDHPSHLVAAKAGVVQSVIAFHGVPLVSEGQTVEKGQPLISGIVPLKWYLAPREGEEVQEPDPLLGQAGAWGYLYADGLVEAQTWYEATAQVPYAAEKLTPTGKEEAGFKLTLAGFVLSWGRKEPSFVEFETEKVRRKWQIPFFFQPVTLDKTIYRQLERVRIEKDLAEAKREALEAARRKLRAQIPPEAKILDEEVETTAEDGTISVRILVSALENIGMSSRIQVGDVPPAGLEGYLANDEE
ncbi:MAG: sporulation protein YqfD [Firmicutes bacterium]|nr:sporulation protein YqfD [Bacillota bacterium]